MNPYEMKNETWSLIEKYNDSFPGNPLGTLDLSDNLTEKELIARLTVAISTKKPIESTDLTIYRDFRSEQERDIYR